MQNVQIYWFLKILTLILEVKILILMVQRYISSEEVSNLLGVNVSTIKRWTDSGKLDCVITAGGHRKFLMRHVSAFLNDNSKYRSKLNVLPYNSSEERQLNQLILTGQISQLRDIFLNKALLGNRELCSQIMTGLYLSGISLDKIYDDLVSPVFKHIGNEWHAGRMPIYKEHIATNTLQTCVHGIYSIINKPSKNEGLSVCIGIRGDMHDIPLMIIEQILLSKGFEVINTGINTPLDKIETLFDVSHPNRIYVSCTWIQNESHVIEDLNKIFEINEKINAEIFLCGPLLNKLKLSKDYNYRSIKSFTELLSN